MPAASPPTGEIGFVFSVPSPINSCVTPAPEGTWPPFTVGANWVCSAQKAPPPAGQASLAFLAAGTNWVRFARKLLRGTLEGWNPGRMEYWNVGMMGEQRKGGEFVSRTSCPRATGRPGASRRRPGPARPRPSLREPRSERRASVHSNACPDSCGRRHACALRIYRLMSIGDDYVYLIPYMLSHSSSSEESGRRDTSCSLTPDGAKLL
jgi:hypothetical protein